MRKFALVSGFCFVALWILSICILSDFQWVNLLSLAKPKSTAELGDSLGLLNGLLSSIAIVLALLAVLIQSKELKDSTKAQNEQADSLKKQLDQQQAITGAQLKQAEAIAKQLEQQQISNRIVGLAARQRFLLSEMARMDLIIASNSGKDDLIGNSKKKKARLQKEAEQIDVEIAQILDKAQ